MSAALATLTGVVGPVAATTAQAEAAGPAPADGCVGDSWCFTNSTNTLTHDGLVVSRSQAPPGFFPEPLSASAMNSVQLYNGSMDGECMQQGFWLVPVCDEADPHLGGSKNLRWTLTAAGNLRLTATQGAIARNSCYYEDLTSPDHYLYQGDCTAAATDMAAQWDVKTINSPKAHSLVNRATGRCLASIGAGIGATLPCDAGPPAQWWMRTFG